MSDNTIAFEVEAGGIYQYIPPNSWNTVNVLTNLTTLHLDTNNGWRPAENGYRVQVAGKYLIQAEIWHEDKASGIFRADLVINGNIVAQGQVAGLTTSVSPIVFGIFNLNVNDLIQLSACASGAPSSIGVAWAVTKLQGNCVGL